jgi:hypothetical protein
MSNDPGYIDSKKLTPLLSDSEIFTYKSQHMDYFDAQGVTLNTGYTNKLEWYLLPIRELLDNACDFLQKNSNDATVIINIHVTKELFHLTVTNSNKNDIKVFSNLKPIFDFDKRYGSKQDVHVISRGMLGDALKQILALGYTLLHANDEGTDFSDTQWDYPLIIRHNGYETKVSLQVDKARQQAHAIPKTDNDNKLNHKDTEIAIILPVIDEVRNYLTREYIEKYCRRYTLLTTDISFKFRIIDDIDHPTTVKQESKSLEESIDDILSKPPEKGVLNIQVPALHPILSDWKNSDSIYSYKPQEFKNRILHVGDTSISLYNVLNKFREGSNIANKYKITVQELLDKPDHERNEIIEQCFIELHNVMDPPKLSLPYPIRFKIGEKIEKRENVLFRRIRRIRPDIVDNPRKMSYKLVKGTVTDEQLLNYPFAFEIFAIPLKDPIRYRDDGSASSKDVKQHEFIGMVNYSFSPKNNFFVGKYYDDIQDFEIYGNNIGDVLESHGFRKMGDNFNKLPCIIVGNLITPKWDPISKDKSGMNLLKQISQKMVSVIKRISKEIETYRAAGHRWRNVGSKSENVEWSSPGKNKNVMQIVEDFLRIDGRLPF